MLYTRLGCSGVKVSNICLGTMTFGPHDRPGNCSEELSHNILDRFVELGGNFVDTADVYCSGMSETIIGNWLQKIGGRRHELVLATKGRFAPGLEGSINGACLSRKHLINEVEESLKRLQTDYIDLYQWHCYDRSTPLEESLRTMDDLVRAGKIRYFGVSNFCGWQLQKLADLCKSMGMTPCISLQQQYSLLSREFELEGVDVCTNEGMAVLPWSPLKGGWLTGKYDKSMQSAPDGTRIQYATAINSELFSHPPWNALANDEVWSLLDKMKAIAKQHEKTVSQVAIRWLLQKKSVTSVVIGCKTVKQLEDNLGASGGWELSDDDMDVLNTASQQKIPYPYSLTDRYNKRFDEFM
ncbi:1-deoxyxylulose-5-phosphate synthase YajO-like [Watersipora subatra]|uniref:1-deoxyxylulose-5-phosphate synthase YajO-like n=1 Tax=Watersipora subatra TaxID=2589382 RepID=UPI00355C4FA7